MITIITVMYYLQFMMLFVTEQQTSEQIQGSQKSQEPRF